MYGYWLLLNIENVCKEGIEREGWEGKKNEFEWS